MTPELENMIREIHAAVTARRGSKPTLGDVVQVATAKTQPDPTDPAIKFDPKGHTGPSRKGTPMSSCSPAYLAQYARLMDACADRNEASGQTRYAKWDREAAQRAREWRARLEGQDPLPKLSADELEAAF